MSGQGYSLASPQTAVANVGLRFLTACAETVRESQPGASPVASAMLFLMGIILETAQAEPDLGEWVRTVALEAYDLEHVVLARDAIAASLAAARSQFV